MSGNSPATMPAAGELSVVTFDVAGEAFALPMDRVSEVAVMPRITRVPGSPPFVRGMVNLRGNVLPVLDLALRFGLGRSREASWLVVVSCDDELLGLAAEAVGKIAGLPRSSIVPPPPRLPAAAAAYLEGVARVAGRFVIMLDLDRLLEGCARGADA